MRHRILLPLAAWLVGCGAAPASAPPAAAVAPPPSALAAPSAAPVVAARTPPAAPAERRRSDGPACTAPGAKLPPKMAAKPIKPEDQAKLDLVAGPGSRED